MRKIDEIQVGELVQSVSGHDAGRYFLVIRREGDILWLCDGKLRKAASPKRKSRKHVAGSGLICTWVQSKPEAVNNTSVRRAIREIFSRTGGENPCQRKMY